MQKYRNLVVFIDGTGVDRLQQEISVRSNVSKLKDSCIHNSSTENPQLLCYTDGVGTRIHESIFGNAAGAGLDERVQEAYLFLQAEVDNARLEGFIPRIYLFGFSRGAFAVRWLAALLHFSGLPCPGVSEKIGLRNLKKNDSEEAQKMKKIGKYYDVSVEMIGVWDTVKTTLTRDFGIDQLPSNVRHAYHAMSIDETRTLFPVFRFKLDERVTEIWFSGVHSDVGGGYKDDSLSRPPLAWMINCAEKHGLLIKEHVSRNETFDSVSPDALVIHDEDGLGWRVASLATGHPRWSSPRTLQAHDYIHESVNIMRNYVAKYNEQIPRGVSTWQPVGPAAVV